MADIHRQERERKRQELLLQNKKDDKKSETPVTPVDKEEAERKKAQRLAVESSPPCAFYCFVLSVTCRAS